MDTTQPGADNALDLDKLEALARAATPGPWYTHPITDDDMYPRGLAIVAENGKTLSDEDTGPGNADAEFIASADPAAVLALIALARRAAQPVEPVEPAEASQRAAAPVSGDMRERFLSAIDGPHRAAVAAAKVPTVEPVAWRFREYDTVEKGHSRIWQVTISHADMEVYKRYGAIIEPLYAAPVEQAAKVQPAVPAVGSALVAKPRNPTEEMLNAARDWSVKKYGIGIGNDAAIGCWQSMHDAAPAGAETGSAAAPAEQTQAARDVLAERRRQVEQEGWTPERDDEYVDGQLAGAASCYAVKDITHWAREEIISRLWPWPAEWWKPRDNRANLVKAGALILADIERLDRAAQPIPTGEQA